MNIGMFSRSRPIIFGVAACSALAIGALFAVLIFQEDDAAEAGDVQVTVQGLEGPESLGSFGPEEAIGRGEAQAGFTFRLPATLPDDQLELTDVIIYPEPGTDQAHHIGLNYRGVGEGDTTDPWLAITLFAPGEELMFGGPESAERVEIGDSVVHIATQEGGPQAQQFVVIDDELPMDVTVAGIPRDAVLVMIEEMVGG